MRRDMLLRVASHLAPGVMPLYAFLAEHLAERLGRTAEFTVATSYERCAEDVDDVCFVCSVPYLLFHSEALRMVARGDVDAAAIDSQVLAIELRDDPELARRVRVIGTIGPSTIQPVVVSTTRLSPVERATITETLIAVGGDPRARPLLDAALVDRFVAVDGDAYDDIRLMLRRVRQAGLVGGDWDDRWLAATGSRAESLVS
jgi:ABC-type phosphate/phosphonate transport system substrate-binding protein